jgi:hypothetical protein
MGPPYSWPFVQDKAEQWFEDNRSSFLVENIGA